MILVDIKTQKLIYLSNGFSKVYKVSSSKFGIGNTNNSYKTPYGLFTIKNKIGTNMPNGTIFKARKATGLLNLDEKNIQNNTDLVCSRILWLSGAQNHNQNTYDRYIYMHGTNHENLLGKEKSYGCIRMANLDIIEIYEKVQINEKVFITV